jgi:hypothetical protein
MRNQHLARSIRRSGNRHRLGLRACGHDLGLLSPMTTILKAIRRACDKAGGQNAWAEAHGLQKSMVSRVLSGERGVSDAILAAVGWERVVTYRKRRNVEAKRQLAP